MDVGLQLQGIKLKHAHSLAPALFIKMTVWPFFLLFKMAHDNYFNLFFSTA